MISNFSKYMLKCIVAKVNKLIYGFTKCFPRWVKNAYLRVCGKWIFRITYIKSPYRSTRQTLNVFTNGGQPVQVNTEWIMNIFMHKWTHKLENRKNALFEWKHIFWNSYGCIHTIYRKRVELCCTKNVREATSAMTSCHTAQVLWTMVALTSCIETSVIRQWMTTTTAQLLNPNRIKTIA